MSKFCSNCGAALADSAMFCGKCGSAVAAPAQPAAPVYQAPAQPVYQAPAQPVYQAPAEPVYQAPAEPVYQAPAESYTTVLNDQPAYAAPAEPAAVYEAPAEPAYYTAPPAEQSYYAPPAEQPAYTDPYAPEESVKKKKFNWKIALIVVLGLALLGVGIYFLIDALFINTPEAQIERVYEYRNSSKYSIDKEKALFNGFGGSDLNDFYSVLKKSDLIEDRKDEWESADISYDIGDKEKIDDDDELEEAQDEINELGESLLNALEDADEDYVADKLGVSTSDAKKLLKAVKGFAKTLKKAKVTEGYEVEITYTVDGEEYDTTMAVAKIDGRWVTYSALSIIYSYAYYLGAY